MGGRILYSIRRGFQALAYDLAGPELMSGIYYRIVMKQQLRLEAPR